MGKSNSAFYVKDKQWFKFWYSPHHYINTSWLQENEFSTLSKYRSPMAWQSCYLHVCNILKLEPNLFQGLKDEWKRNLWSIAQKPDKAIELAGIAYNKTSGKRKENSNSHITSLDECRRLSQIGQGLALKQRFSIPDELEDKQQQGLWLLYTALLSDCPEVWPRMRLAFKSSLLSKWPKIEETYNVIDIKNLRRLWNIIVCKL